MDNTRRGTSPIVPNSPRAAGCVRSRPSDRPSYSTLETNTAVAARIALRSSGLDFANLIARRFHRLDDVLIAGAAAQVRGKHIDQIFVADMRVLFQHVGGEHQKT